MRPKIFLTFVLVFLIACSPQSGREVSPLLNVDSLLTAQVNALTEFNATLNKVVSYNGKQDSTIFTPNKSEWAGELEFLRELDIVNKPVYRDRYAVTTTKDAKSNLTVRGIAAQGDVPLRSLNLFYYKTPANLKRVEAGFHLTKVLYTQGQEIRIELREIGGKAVITGWSLYGTQKVILIDTSRYSAECHIVLP